LKERKRKDKKMRILIDIGHPAHVHFFKNFVWEMEKRGHIIKITARDKECTLQLLNAYNLSYTLLGKHHKSIFNKALGMLKLDYSLYKIGKKFKPDILTGINSPYAAHASKLLGRPYITFGDTEHANLIMWLTNPFSDVTCTPSCFKKDLGSKQIRYDGFHELAYLHPNYFKPNPEVLAELNLAEDEKFFILRFVAWVATHDVGHEGLSLTMKRNIIDKLKTYGKVFITSEIKLPKNLEKYKLDIISPEKIHDLLYYATMYIGEGATMTTESGILGTPGIYISSFSSLEKMGNLNELEKKYGLVYSFNDASLALKKINELLKKNDLKREWQIKREKLLKDKIDVTKWMVDFIENYPESFYHI
jgi:hypothetical protein